MACVASEPRQITNKHKCHNTDDLLTQFLSMLQQNSNQSIRQDIDEGG